MLRPYRQSHAYLQQAWNSGSASSARCSLVAGSGGQPAFSTTRAFRNLPQPPCPQPLQVLPKMVWQGFEGPWLG